MSSPLRCCHTVSMLGLDTGGGYFFVTTCYYVFKERNKVRNGSHSGANVVTNRVWSCTYRKQGLLLGQQGGQCAGDHDIVVHEPPICHGITKEVSMGARLIRAPIGRIIQALHGLPYSPVTSMTFGSRHAPRQTSSRVYMTIDRGVHALQVSHAALDSMQHKRCVCMGAQRGLDVLIWSLGTPTWAILTYVLPLAWHRGALH